MKPNPLYLLGAGRVGCFPCVLVNHRELKALSLACQKFVGASWHWSETECELFKRYDDSHAALLCQLDSVAIKRALDGKVVAYRGDMGAKGYILFNERRIRLARGLNL